MGGLRRLGRQGFVVVGLRGIRIEGERELVVPAELEAGLAHRVVPGAGSGMTFGDIGGMGRQLIRNHAGLHVVAVGQAEVLLRRDVAEHRRAAHRDVGRTDGRGDVVVAGRDIGDEGTEGIEGGIGSPVLLQLVVFLNHIERDVAGALDHDLDVVLPGATGELADGLQLRKLCGVIGVREAAGAQAVAEGEGDVVAGEDFAELVEVLIKEGFLVVGEAPAGHDGTAAADDAGDALGGERNVGKQHAGVDGHVVHALLALLDDGVTEDLPGEVLRDAVYLFQCLVDGHRADGDGGVAQDPLAGRVDIVARGEIHDGVRAPAGGPAQLRHFFLDGACDRRVADVGVDLGEELPADDHGLGLGVVDVVGDDGAPAGDLGADELWIAVLAQGDEFHFLGDNALAGVVHLGDAFDPPTWRGLCALPFLGRGTTLLGRLAVVSEIACAALVFFGVVTLFDPCLSQGRKPLRGIAFRAAGAVDAERLVGAGGGVVELDFGFRDLETLLTDRRVGVLGVDFLLMGSRHGPDLSSFAGANQTGSNGAAAAPAAISARFHAGSRGDKCES